VVADRARGHQLVEGEHAVVGDPEGQHRAGPGQRRQDGVETGAVGEPDVDVRNGVVKPAATDGGKPLGEPPDGTVVGEAHLGALQARAPVDVDLSGTVDQDVRDIGQPQQRLQRARTQDVASQGLVDGQNRRIAHRTPRGSQRVGDPMGGQRAR